MLINEKFIPIVYEETTYNMVKKTVRLSPEFIEGSKGERSFLVSKIHPSTELMTSGCLSSVNAV